MNALIEQARAQYGEILPCARKATLEECFTTEWGALTLWFNTPDGNTHTISEKSPA